MHLPDLELRHTEQARCPPSLSQPPTRCTCGLSSTCKFSKNTFGFFKHHVFLPLLGVYHQESSDKDSSGGVRASARVRRQGDGVGGGRPRGEVHCEGVQVQLIQPRRERPPSQGDQIEINTRGFQLRWGGFITAGFRPVFSPEGFIALFRQLLENGSKNFWSRVLGSFRFQVFLPF